MFGVVVYLMYSGLHLLSLHTYCINNITDNNTAQKIKITLQSH